MKTYVSGQLTKNSLKMSRNRMRQELMKYVYDVNSEKCEREINSIAVRKCSRMNM